MDYQNYQLFSEQDSVLLFFFYNFDTFFKINEYKFLLSSVQKHALQFQQDR